MLGYIGLISLSFSMMDYFVDIKYWGFDCVERVFYRIDMFLFLFDVINEDLYIYN